MQNNDNVNFAQKFQESLKKLTDIKNTVSGISKNNKDFRGSLQPKLVDIQESLDKLKDYINGLKTQASNLTSKIKDNDNSVQRCTSEKEKLSQQITQLQNNLTNTNKRISDLENQINQKQAEIDEKENDLKVMTEERDALKTAIENKGSAAVKQQALQAEKHTEEVNALNAKIAESEKKINDLEAQLKEKEQQHTELQGRHQAIETEHNEKNTRLADLNANIDKLKEENNKLRDYLTQLLGNIDTLAIELNGMLNDSLEADDQNRINDMLNSIKNTIDDLTRETPSAQINQPEQQPTLPLNTSIGTTTYGEIINRVKALIEDKKNRGSRRDVDRYTNLLNELLKANTQADVLKLLDRTRLRNNYFDYDILNNTKFGGRKTRKNKKNKQKGGFVYKSNTKRKSISHSSKSSRTTSTSTKRHPR